MNNGDDIAPPLDVRHQALKQTREEFAAILRDQFPEALSFLKQLKTSGVPMTLHSITIGDKTWNFEDQIRKCELQIRKHESTKHREQVE